MEKKNNLISPFISDKSFYSLVIVINSSLSYLNLNVLSDITVTERKNIMMHVLTSFELYEIQSFSKIYKRIKVINIKKNNYTFE